MRILGTLALSLLLLACGGGGGGGGSPPAPQVPGQTFGGAGNDTAFSIWQNTDGGFIIAGSTTSMGSGGRDVYLIRTNSAGLMLWANAYGGSGEDYAASVQQTADGSFIVAGSTNSNRPGLTHGGYDIYLVKMDASGVPSWERFFGGAGDDYGLSVQQTSDLGFILVGTHPGGDGEPDAWLIKTDVSGAVVWQTSLGGPISYPGGTMNNWWVEGHSVQQTSDGGYVVAGRAESLSFDGVGTPVLGAEGFDMYLARTDSTGNLLWQKTIGGAGDQGGNAVRQTADGGYVIAGFTEGGLREAYLVRTDESGNVQWAKGLGPAYDAASDILQTSDGGFIVAGAYRAANGDLCLVKTDASGNIQWTRTVGGNGSESGSSVRQMTNGGFVAAGSTTSWGAGASDAYLVRTDSGGNVQ